MHGLLVYFAGMVLAAPPPLPDEIVNMFDDRVTYFSKGEETEREPFHWRLLKPASIEPGRKYPVVLFLHGAGERGDDNISQLNHFPVVMAGSENREKYPCFVVAPQCPKNQKWNDVDWTIHASQPMKDEPADPMKIAIAAMDQVLAEFPCDLDRVYLTGLSMGGFGSWDLATRSPERFAAVAPICGGGDVTRADRLVNTPIWAWHGDQDHAVPVERSREMIAAIEKAGGHPKYTELPDVGHASWVRAYGDPDGVIPWMFAEKRERK